MATEITTEHSEDSNRAPSMIDRGMLFLKDVRQEMTKVVAPGRAEVQSTTVVVIITVFFFAAFFEFVDLTLGRGIDQLLLHLTKH